MYIYIYILCIYIYIYTHVCNIHIFTGGYHTLNSFWLHMLALHFHVAGMEITFAVELWGGPRS